MGHWKELVPSDWIRAVDIHGDWTVKIRRITFESVASLDAKQDDDKGSGDKKAEPRKKRKGALWFYGVDKGWLINNTNAQLVAALFGDDPAGWIDHEVTLYSAKVRGADGQPTQGIRVKGSPEMRGEIVATVTLPRRKPVKVKLIPTGRTAPGFDDVPPPEPGTDG